ncbi:unnamed protein product [Euphydryas editha]|uniref:Secreted protein n=1 Tax=Euphydryas editha TaxID=104508 RepID=A0AAU9UAM8_EUPED|nr:unnamed protein product [Euphydryas editha]
MPPRARPMILLQLSLAVALRIPCLLATFSLIVVGQASNWGGVSKKVSTLGALGRCNGGRLRLLSFSIRGKARKRLDRWRETTWKGVKAPGGARRRVKERENVWTATKEEKGHGCAAGVDVTPRARSRMEEDRARSLLPLDGIKLAHTRTGVRERERG